MFVIKALIKVSKISSWLSFVKLKNSFVLVLLLIQILLVTLSVLFYNIAAFILKKDEIRNIESTYSLLKNQIDYETSKGLLPLLSILENKEITEIFAKKQRDELYEISKPLFENLKSHGIKQFQFNSPTLITFLRVHHPEQFGDDLSTYRPMVQKVNLEKKILMGLEQGRSGFGFRTVVPVFKKGKNDSEYLGTMELGSGLDGVFLGHIQKLFPGDWLIYNLSRNTNTTTPQLVASLNAENTNSLDETYYPEEEIINKVKIGNMEYRFDSNKNIVQVFMPVRNYNNEVALLFLYSYETDYFKSLLKIGLYSMGVALFGLISSAIILIFLYRRITHPIRELVDETKKIKEFRLESNIKIESNVQEIQELVDSVSSMKQGLLSFRKYVPAELVRDLIETKQEAKIGGERRNLTIIFTDIANFTTISEAMRPGELAEKLSEYLQVVTTAIIKYRGTVDKYIGDAVMAFWGAPRELADHATFACLAALEIEKEIKKLNERWSKEGKKTLNTRIGISTGDTIVGNFGSDQRLNYTVIGDPVNLASRLEALNKQYGTGILISHETQKACFGKIETRKLDNLYVKGKTESVSIYELISEKGDMSAKEASFRFAFEDALQLFESNEKEKAKIKFEELRKAHPNNISVDLYIQRCEDHKINSK